MSNAFSGSRQQLYSPYSQIGTDPFGYSPGGTFMGGGIGGFGGGFGMPSFSVPSFSNPFSGGGFGFGSGIGGFGGGMPQSSFNLGPFGFSFSGSPTTFGGMNMGGGSQGYQFPVRPQPNVNDLFGQYMMNQYYGGDAFNPYTLPQSQPRMSIPRQPSAPSTPAPSAGDGMVYAGGSPGFYNQTDEQMRDRYQASLNKQPVLGQGRSLTLDERMGQIQRNYQASPALPPQLTGMGGAGQMLNFAPNTSGMQTPALQPVMRALPAPATAMAPSPQAQMARMLEMPQFSPNLAATPAAIQQQLNTGMPVFRTANLR